MKLHFVVKLITLSELSIITDSRTVYTEKESTTNLIFEFDPRIYFWSYRKIYTLIDIETNKYDIISRPNIIDLQIQNVSANDTGTYWIDVSDVGQYTFQLRFDQTVLYFKMNLSSIRIEYKTDISCQSLEPYNECAINGSSAVLKFIIEASVCYSPKEDRIIEMQAKTIKQFDKACGLLHLQYAPVVTCHLTNTTIKCDCDGIPEKYSVYRLDQISRNGELVRSVNLNTEIFTFRTDPFPYQKNGRYTCFVSNGIPDTTGKVLQIWSTNVTYEENLPLAKDKRIIFVIVCCIASILLVYLTIIHVCVCVKYVKTRNQRLQNLQEDHIYHTYDEIGTIAFRAVSSLHSADIIDNLGQNPTGEHTNNVSFDANLQSTTDYTTELNAGFLNDGLQREITDVHGQGSFISLLDTNFSNTDLSPISSTGMSRIQKVANCNQTRRNTERSREQKSKTCKTSNDVMVGNAKNEYENNYQLQDGHQYLETLDRQFRISATDYGTNTHQKSQTSNDCRPTNNAMVGQSRNEYENNYQLQDGNLYFETLDDGQISISSTMDSIVKIQQRSQTISDASSGSSDKSRFCNVRNEYENNYQLQDGNLYLEILDDRHITILSSDSIEKNQQRSKTISDADSGSSNNGMVGNVRNKYENNYQLQDGHLYLDILDDRPITLSSTDSITKNQQRSQTISDADSVSSNNAVVDNVRNEYENNYQLQDGNLYFDILDDSQNIISATDYSTNKQTQSQTSDDFNSGSSNNAIEDNEINEFENNYQMILQDMWKVIRDIL
ncbi:unnamed protein product [Mytilus edulis]|uniref:Ig-like domain-containing protein n=1 Tax=Mytilus edulis TaxID=6550 RepID=A0A8S3TB79_MYTED|nr:unnamed protein product [Mytilus edulis]